MTTPPSGPPVPPMSEDWRLRHLPGEWPPVEERLWSRVVPAANGCLEWTGGTNGDGYGSIEHQGLHKSTHRLAWELTNGPIPVGMWVLHRCDNPPCCNPEHLFLGTSADNIHDMDAKGRRVVRFFRGSDHPCARLTDRDVRDIRRRVAGGETQEALARAYSLSSAYVSQIVSRKKWRHLSDKAEGSGPQTGPEHEGDERTG